MNEDAKFFEHMRTCQGPYRILGECFHEVLSSLTPISRSHGPGRPSCIDIGCGVGAQCERMGELGWSVLGVDTEEAGKHRFYGPWKFFSLDLATCTELIALPSDVMISTETAEHLPDELGQKLVHIMARNARSAIIFSAAQPGQEWEGHINLQPIEYWTRKFNAFGWALDTERTQFLRTRMVSRNAQHMHCRENFVVLVRP